MELAWETSCTRKSHRLIKKGIIEAISLSPQPRWISLNSILKQWGCGLKYLKSQKRKLKTELSIFMGAIHALEHAMIGMFPLLVLCDRNDIGGISCPAHHQTSGSVIFIYDGYPGGMGLCSEAYFRMEELLMQTARTVMMCRCKYGCPSCVHSPKCGSGNRPIDKTACIALINLYKSRAILEMDLKRSRNIAS